MGKETQLSVELIWGEKHIVVTSVREQGRKWESLRRSGAGKKNVERDGERKRGGNGHCRFYGAGRVLI